MAEYLYTFHDHITDQVSDLELDYSEIPHSDYLLVYQSSNRGKVLVHKAHGKDELKANLVIASRLADLGLEVRLLPVNPRISTPQPDAQIGETLWEFKTLKSKTTNALDKAVQKAARQANYCVIGFSTDYSDSEWRELLSQNWEHIQRRIAMTNIEEMVFMPQSESIRAYRGILLSTNPFIEQHKTL
jgi:hypothetical protein